MPPYALRERRSGNVKVADGDTDDEDSFTEAQSRSSLPLSAYKRKLVSFKTSQARERWRQSEILRLKIYRANLSDEKVAVCREKGRIRQHRYLQRKREAAELECGLTRSAAEKKKLEKKRLVTDREKARLAMRERRAARTEEQKQAENTRRREQYRLKKLNSSAKQACKSDASKSKDVAVPQHFRGSVESTVPLPSNGEEVDTNSLPSKNQPVQ